MRRRIARRRTLYPAQEGNDSKERLVEAPILHRLSLFDGDASGDVDSIGFKATEKRLLPIIQFLLEHGADPSVRDPRFDATALEWARHTVPSSEAVGALLENYMRS